MKNRWALLLAPLVLGLVGCSRQPKVALTPVTGTVKINGSPAAGINVIFHPIGRTKSLGSATGRTGDDGSYTLKHSGGGPGAAPGDYKVTLADTTGGSSDTAKGKAPSRIPPEYGEESKTILSNTVPDAACSFDISVRIPN